MIDTIDLPLPILTPRLLLRPPQPGDGAAAYEAVIESWTEFSKWGIWILGPRDEVSSETYEAFCDYKRAKFLAREDLTFLVFDRVTENFIGVGGLHKCDWRQRIFSLGFWVRASRMRLGYATEVGTALLNYAFGTLSASKVITHHAEGNLASQSVIAKLGFQSDGVLPGQHALPDGSLVDECCYSIKTLAGWCQI